MSIGTCAVGIPPAALAPRKRADLCAENGHPGATYHPQMDKTWCLCGEVARDGNHFTHAACCDGPLIDLPAADGTTDPAAGTGGAT